MPSGHSIVTPVPLKSSLAATAGGKGQAPNAARNDFSSQDGVPLNTVDLGSCATNSCAVQARCVFPRLNTPGYPLIYPYPEETRSTWIRQEAGLKCSCALQAVTVVNTSRKHSLVLKLKVEPDGGPDKAAAAGKLHRPRQSFCVLHEGNAATVAAAAAAVVRQQWQEQQRQQPASPPYGPSFSLF